MRRYGLLTILALLAAIPLLRGSVQAQDQEEYYGPEARVWLDRGEEPVLRRGERVRVYYRVSESAFVAIFHIDTNGTVRLVFPSSPQENHYARGGRDYRVLFPGSSYWFVDEAPGLGYFFIVASPVPFDFSRFRYSHYAGGWDLTVVGRQVYQDPYLAMDDYVAALLPNWDQVAYGLDFTSYSVDQHYDYPRFLCYDCHGFRPYYSWNPYHYTCTNFRVIIYDNPYFYPATRYRGSRVVYTQPRRGVAHFGFKERAEDEPGTPMIVVDGSGAGSRPGVEGNGNRRAVPRGSAASGGGQGSGVTNPASDPGRAARPGVEGTTNRRGGSRESIPLTAPRRPSGQGERGRQSTPLITPPGTDPDPRVERNPERPTLQRRPATGRTATPPSAGRASGGSGAKATRPTSRLRKKSGGSGTVRPGPIRSGTVRSGASRSGTVRSGSRGSAVRRGGASTTRRPTARVPNTRTVRPPSRATKPPSRAVRPPTRSTVKSGSRTVRPPTRTTRPPKRTVRPPTRKKTTGGGGGRGRGSGG